MQVCYLPSVFLTVCDFIRYIDAATLNATSSPQLAVIGESSSVTVRCSYTMLPSEEFCNLSLLRFATPNSDPVELASLHAGGPNRNYTFYQTSLRTGNTSSASESNTTNSMNTHHGSHRSRNRTHLNTFGAQQRTWSVLSSESERFVEVEHSHTTCDDDGSVFSCVLEFRVQSEFLLREIAKNITVAVEVSTVSMSAFPNTTSIAEFTVMTFTCQGDVHRLSQGGFQWFILGGTNVTEVSNVSENDAMTLRGELSTYVDFTSSATTGILPGGLPCTKRLTSNIRMLTNHTEFGPFFEVRCFIVNSMSEATDHWNCSDRLCSSHWVSTTYRCLGGFYGFKCKKRCGHCIERRCNYESGACSACKQGYELPLCTGGSADSTKVVSDLGGLIAGGTVAFLALGMGVFLACWNCQRCPQAGDRLVETRVHSPGRRSSNPVMIRSSTSSRVRFLVDKIPDSWTSLGSGSTHLDEISCKINEKPDPQQADMDPDVQQPDLKQPGVLGASPGQPVVSEPTVQQPAVLRASVQQPGVLGTSVNELTVLGASIPKPTVSRTIMKKPGRFGGSSKQPAVAETFVNQPGVSRASVSQPCVLGASVNHPGFSRASVSQPCVLGASVNQPCVLGASVNQPGVSRASVNQPGVLGASVNQPGVLGASGNQPGVLGASVSRPGDLGVSVSQPGVLGASVSRFGDLGVSVSQPGVLGASVSQPDVLGASVSQPDVLGVSVSQPGVLGASVSQPDVLRASLQQLGVLKPGVNQPDDKAPSKKEPGCPKPSGLECSPVLEPSVVESCVDDHDSLHCFPD